MGPSRVVLGIAFAAAVVAGSPRREADAAAIREIREPVAAPSRPHAAELLAGLPASFDANAGQFDERVRFVAQAGGVAAWLVDGEAVLRLGQDSPGLAGDDLRSRPPTRCGGVLRMRLPSAATPRGEARLASNSNWFLGNDPSRWRTDVPSFAQARYREVAPGVDVVWRGTRRALEYDVVVAPGADLGAFSMEIDGARSVAVDQTSGELVVTTPADAELRQSKPRCFQVLDGVRRELAGRFVVRGARVAFAVEGRDPSRELVVDPTLGYSTFLGASSWDATYAHAVAPGGEIVLAGQTSSYDFPLVSAIQTSYQGGLDIYVAKIKADGSGLAFSTFLGGSGTDFGSAIAFDANGNVYLAAISNSGGLPVVSAAQTSSGGAYDGYIVKLPPTGNSITYATYLGGSADEYPYGIAVDTSGSAYVTGTTRSSNFPTASARQGTYGGGSSDAFVTKLSPSGGSFVYSTYHGGSAVEFAYFCALDGGGALALGGYSTSSDLPVRNAFQPTMPVGGTDGFVAKYNAAGNALVFGTFLGGSGLDSVEAVAMDASGTVYACGRTQSSNFPTASPTQASYGGGTWDAFVTKFQPTGASLAFSSYLGGSLDEDALGIVADSSGGFAVTGSTASSNFPVFKATQPGFAGGAADGFVARFAASSATPVYSTFVGGSGEDRLLGIGFDQSGTLSVSGYSYSNDFPSLGALQGTNKGNCDTVVVKFAPTVPAQPTGLLASLAGSFVHLAWTDKSSDETGFEVQRKLNAGQFTSYATVPAGAIVYDDTSIYPSQTYTYRVRAIGAEGLSAASNESAVTTPGTAPIPPVPRPPDGLQALVVSSTEVDLTWTDRSNDEMVFEVQRADGGAAFASVGTAPQDTTSFADTGVLPGWPVSFRIRALAVQGPSVPSAVATVLPPSEMTLATSKGSVTDSAKPHKDKVTWTGTLVPADAAAVLDPKAQGLRLQVGPPDAPVVLVIAANDPKWKVRKSKFTWKGGGGLLPKVTVVVDAAKRTIAVTATAFDFAAAASTSFRALVAVGATSGGLSEPWVAGRKLGTFAPPKP